MKPFAEVRGRPAGSKVHDLRFSDSNDSWVLCVPGALGGSTKYEFDQILNLHLAYEMPCPNESVVSIQGPTMISYFASWSFVEGQAGINSQSLRGLLGP